MAVVLSKSFSLKRGDFQKVGRGALVAGVGAILTYLLEAVPGLDIPDEYKPMLVAGLSVLANLVRKWWTENRY